MTDTKVQATAQQLVLGLFRAKEDLKQVKNALKAYKITSEDLEDLKEQRKKLTQMINEEKDRIEAEFLKDDAYKKLREEQLDAKERIQVAKLEIKGLLKDPTKQKEFLEMEVDVDGVPMKIQTQLSLKLYFNGKEEK